MGWMNDSLRYIEEDPINRKWHHHLATFGMVYAYDEHFILPISHDEVVHGKGSLWEKMPGDEWQKFANLRLYLGFMWTHPGQKLLFMGCEFAQRQEWKAEQSLDWHVLDWDGQGGDFHRGIQKYVARLNQIYCQTPALHALDHQGEGFEWGLVNDADRSVLSYRRFAYTDHRKGKGARCFVIHNATPLVREYEQVGLPHGRYRIVLNSDSIHYGGSGVGPQEGALFQSDPQPWQGQEASLTFSLPPLGTLLLVSDDE